MPELDLVTTPEDIVDAALTIGLEAIAITDHNTAEGVDAVREVAAKKGIWIIPGVEFSARGGHVLALFDLDTPVERLQELLSRLDLDDEKQGKGFMATDLWMDEVFREVEGSGGVAIAAHIDRRQGGFAASTESLADKKRIHNSRYLSALEVTIPADRFLWNEGRMPHYSREVACVQGSDAHAPEEIGRRPLYLNAPSFDLDSLRLCFRQFRERIRFPEDLFSTQ